MVTMLSVCRHFKSANRMPSSCRFSSSCSSSSSSSPFSSTRWESRSNSVEKEESMNVVQQYVRAGMVFSGPRPLLVPMSSFTKSKRTLKHQNNTILSDAQGRPISQRGSKDTLHAPSVEEEWARQEARDKFLDLQHWKHWADTKEATQGGLVQVHSEADLIAEALQEDYNEFLADMEEEIAISDQGASEQYSTDTTLPELQHLLFSPFSKYAGNTSEIQKRSEELLNSFFANLSIGHVQKPKSYTMVWKQLSDFSASQKLKFGLVGANGCEYRATLRPYSFGQRQALIRVSLLNTANIVDGKDIYVDLEKKQGLYPRTMILPGKIKHQVEESPMPVHDIGFPGSRTLNPTLYARRISIIAIRRKKMNKHKWKKLRRKYRDSNRYNRSRKKRNRDRLREEAKELGLEFQ